MHWKSEITSCDEARGAIVDALTGNAVAADSAALDPHLASCDDCRAFRDECATLWRELGSIGAPPPSADAQARFERAMADETPRVPAPAPARARSRLARWGAIAAAIVAIVVASGAGGYQLATVRAGARSDAPQFLLLLHDGSTIQLMSSPGKHAEIVAEYSAWAGALRSRGELVAAEELRDDPLRVLSAAGVTAAPAGDRISGFFLIRARDFAEAQRIAESCPHLKHGGRVELRAIQPT